MQLQACQFPEKSITTPSDHAGQLQTCQLMLNVITSLSTLRRHNSTYVSFPVNPQHPFQTCQLYCTPPNPSDKFPNLSAWGQWQTYQAPEECYTPVSGQNSHLAHCKPVKPWDYSKPVILEENYNPASPFTQLQPYQTLEYQFTHVPAPFRPLQPCQPKKKTITNLPFGPLPLKTPITHLSDSRTQPDLFHTFHAVQNTKQACKNWLQTCLPVQNPNYTPVAPRSTSRYAIPNLHTPLDRPTRVALLDAKTNV